MLGTRDRTLFLDSLRPPAGYRLRRAVGTSFTLDLMALLTAPLAFTFFDAHDDDGAPMADPVLMLEALRRHAETITLFCQAGAIGVPRPGQGLLAFLERSVIEVQAPREGGIFHPKVWVLAFEADGAPTVYRVLCLSRNLTFARAWDTSLRLEGKLTEDQGDDGRNGPFAELLLALPKLSARAISPELQEELKRMASEIRRVDFQLPLRFKDFRVHNFGLGERRDWPFPKAGRSLVVSPFLVGSTIGDLMRDHGLDVLISRPEAFEDIIRRAGREALPRTCYVLSSGADLDSRDAENEGKEGSDEPPDQDEIELVGLHAKLFLFEHGWGATLFTGSANATGAAFGQNVEVLIELRGMKSKCGIDTLLGLEDDASVATLRSILQEYRPPDSIKPPKRGQGEAGEERRPLGPQAGRSAPDRLGARGRGPRALGHRAIWTTPGISRRRRGQGMASDASRGGRATDRQSRGRTGRGGWSHRPGERDRHLQAAVLRGVDRFLRVRGDAGRRTAPGADAVRGHGGAGRGAREPEGAPGALTPERSATRPPTSVPHPER